MDITIQLLGFNTLRLLYRILQVLMLVHVCLLKPEHNAM